MEILSLFWNDYLYVPLFNFLIFLYTNYASYNLGVAVIILTIVLRLALMPFSVLVERGKIVGDELEKKVHEIEHDFANDPVKRKLEIRKFLKSKKIHPWAKAIVMGVQLLVLVLLYQVFIGGINTETKLHLLYSFVPRPDFINVIFLGFDISKSNMILPAIVAGYLFAEIMIDHWEKRKEMAGKEVTYAVIFPAFSFLLLVMLPSVKSVFILTSLIFSSIISLFTAMIKFSLKQTKKTIKKA